MQTRIRHSLPFLALLLLPSLAFAGGNGPIVERYEQDREPRPGHLGIEIVGLTPELAEHLGAPDGGVLVGRIDADGAAARAGLEVGDLLTAIEGRRIDSARDLSRELSFYDAGESVRLDAIRDGRSMEVEAVLEAGSRRRVVIAGPSRPHVEIDVDLEELAESLSTIGVTIGHEVGHALAGIDWDEIGEAIEDGLEGLEGLEELRHLEGLENLEELEIHLEGLGEELDRELRGLEEELERELRDGELVVRRQRV